MTMEQLAGVIEKVISESNEVDWLIIRKLAELAMGNDIDRFSFIEEEEKMEEPFRFRQGWMTVSDGELTSFKEQLGLLVQKNNSNLIALGNLFVVQSQVSCSLAERQELENFFKVVVGPGNLPTLYEVLMTSLNEKFFVHTGVDRDPVVGAEDWFRLFQRFSGHGRTHGILVLVVLLITDSLDAEVGIRYVKQMKPSIRAALCGFWGMGVKMSDDELRSLIKDGVESPFLAAYLVNKSRGRKEMPEWMTIELVESLFADWRRTGSFLLKQVFGGRQRRAGSDGNQKQMEELVEAAMAGLLKQESTRTTGWISQLEFPTDFVGVFACIGRENLAYGDVTQSNREQLFKRALQQLWQIFSDIPALVSDNKDRESPSYWPLSDQKFKHLMTVLLLLYLEVGDKESRKKFRNICFETKLLFYGAYQTSSLARKLAELVLMTSLSAKAITGLSEEMFAALDQLLTDLVETVLVPFVHTIEREEEIWNPELEGVVGMLRSGNLLVNDALAEIKKSDLYPRYQTLFAAIDEIAVAQWPYMDGREVPLRVTGIERGGQIMVGTGNK
jgi:hypothetical protein